MTLKKYLRRFFKKERTSEQQLEYVREITGDPPSRAIRPSAAALSIQEAVPSPTEIAKEDEIAFSPQGDLEAYVRGLAVSREAIERWISAGVLLPEETRVATKMIRIMCKQDKRKIH